MPLQLKLLGGARIERDDGPLRGRAAHRRRLALLALLAGAPGGFLGRERIIGVLWPESPEDAARHLLSESLYVLRRELDENVLANRGDEVGLNPDLLAVDLILFRRAIAEAEWRRAAELYAGPFLDGFYVDDAPDFQRWADTEREEIGREYGRALTALAEAAEAAGDAAEAAQWWGRLAVHDPYSSRTVLRLMNTLAGAGERARAVQVAASFASRLRDELAIEPDPEILQEAERLRSEPAEARAAPAAPPPTPVAPGSPAAPHVHDFEVIRPIGQGSVASVFLAREPLLGRLVAIKVLARPLVDDETARLRFEREARAAARIQHPYVATVFRVGHTADGDPYLVMPYVSGGSLEDRLAASGPLPPEDARRFTGQLAAGLAAAHRLGIVHRDVRPANVLFDRDTDRVLLTDFGLAAVVETGQERLLRLTLPGELLGSPRYSSPEQIRGEPVTERADVYSLGIVAFELLTGRFPFDATTPVQMTLAHARETPRQVSELRPDVEPLLDDLIQRCLNKRPEQRPFAADIADALL